MTEVLFTASVRGWGEPVNWRSFVEPETGGVIYLAHSWPGWTAPSISGTRSQRPGTPRSHPRPRRHARPAPRHGRPPGPDDGEPPGPLGPVRPARGHLRADRGSTDVDRRLHLLRADRRLRGGERLPPLRCPLPAGRGHGLHHLHLLQRDDVPGARRPPGDDRHLRGWELRQRLCSRQYTPAPAGRFRFALQPTGSPSESPATGVSCCTSSGTRCSGTRELANFGFAHSAGDSLAAIQNDPGSLAADRFGLPRTVAATTPRSARGVMGMGRRRDRRPRLRERAGPVDDPLPLLPVDRR